MSAPLPLIHATRRRKARTILTSPDPEYTEKLDRIRSILSELRPDDAFFSIDEFGPFAVKMQPGRALSAPGEQRVVPQWQRSRGCLIMTAALELSGNQVTHFYSPKKNTAEMIRMMELLVERYRDRRKLYLSWDAASWHISKSLHRRVEEYNAAVPNGGGPSVETAPLPSGAQFLNVIESVFSGMARSIIHNSDYRRWTTRRRRSTGTSRTGMRTSRSTPGGPEGRSGARSGSWPTSPRRTTARAPATAEGPNASQFGSRSSAEQHRAFVETARALGCDEDEAAFDEKLKKLVPPKTKPAPGAAVAGRKKSLAPEE